MGNPLALPVPAPWLSPCPCLTHTPRAVCLLFWVDSKERGLGSCPPATVPLTHEHVIPHISFNQTLTCSRPQLCVEREPDAGKECFLSVRCQGRLELLVTAHQEGWWIRAPGGETVLLFWQDGRRDFKARESRHSDQSLDVCGCRPGIKKQAYCDVLGLGFAYTQGCRRPVFL